MDYRITDIKTNEVLATEKRIGAAQHSLITFLATGHVAIIKMHAPNGKELELRKLSRIGEGR